MRRIHEDSFFHCSFFFVFSHAASVLGREVRPSIWQELQIHTHTVTHKHSQTHSHKLTHTMTGIQRSLTGYLRYQKDFIMALSADVSVSILQYIKGNISCCLPFRCEKIVDIILGKINWFI